MSTSLLYPISAFESQGRAPTNVAHFRRRRDLQGKGNLLVFPLTEESQTPVAYLNQDSDRFQLFLSTTLLNGTVGVLIKKIESEQTEE